MKTILVPIDYSNQSRQALIFAVDIARVSKAAIILFHAFHEPLSVGNALRVDEAIAQLEREKNDILAEFAEEVKYDICKDFKLQFISTHHKKPNDTGNLTKSGNHVMAIDQVVAERAAVNITCVSKFGLAADEILAAAATFQADIIIMSSRGAGAVSQAFMGSTVTVVFQSAKVPVLVLPSLAPIKPIQNIVFSANLACLPSNFLLDSLRQLVKITGANLQVLHLYKDNNPQEEQVKTMTALDALDSQLSDLNYQVYFRQVEDIATGIQAFMQEQQADLLVLIPQRHTFLEKLFKKSITGKFTEQANLALLTLPYQTNPLPVAATEKIMGEKG
jgi:nucleotide-binding universal stress UspA family protein